MYIGCFFEQIFFYAFFFTKVFSFAKHKVYQKLKNVITQAEEKMSTASLLKTVMSLSDVEQCIAKYFVTALDPQQVSSQSFNEDVDNPQYVKKNCFKKYFI